MAWGAAIAGGAGIIGGWLANRNRRREAKTDRRFASREAGRQMEFQQKMRNTQWQAGIADMEAAGINPAVAYSQGGASAPMGASGSGSQAEVDEIVTSGVSSAMQAKRMQADLKVLKAQEENIGEDTFLKQQQRHTANSLAAKYDIEQRSLKTALPGLQNIEKFERGAAGEGSALIRAIIRAARGR